MGPDHPRERGDAGVGGPGLDPDAVLDALATDRRRRILRILRTADDAVSIGDLAQHVVALERQTPPQSLPSDDAERVATRLYHVDLPKLRDAALVEYDDRTREVELGVDQSDFDELLADEFGMNVA